VDVSSAHLSLAFKNETTDMARLLIINGARFSTSELKELKESKPKVRSFYAAEVRRLGVKVSNNNSLG